MGEGVASPGSCDRSAGAGEGGGQQRAGGTGSGAEGLLLHPLAFLPPPGKPLPPLSLSPRLTTLPETYKGDPESSAAVKAQSSLPVVVADVPTRALGGGERLLPLARCSAPAALPWARRVPKRPVSGTGQTPLPAGAFVLGAGGRGLMAPPHPTVSRSLQSWRRCQSSGASVLGLAPARPPGGQVLPHAPQPSHPSGGSPAPTTLSRAHTAEARTCPRAPRRTPHTGLCRSAAPQGRAHTCS